MTSTRKILSIEPESLVGQNMNIISFSELMQDLTGRPFEEIYKDFLTQGEIHDHQGNLE